MAKKLLPQKSIDEPTLADLDEVSIRMDRDGEPAELRVRYRLRDGDDPVQVVDGGRSHDVRVSALQPNVRASVDSVRAGALDEVRKLLGF